MEDSTEEGLIVLAESLRRDGKAARVKESLRVLGMSRAGEKRTIWHYKPIEITGDLKQNVEADLVLAGTVLADVGYSASEVSLRLPTIAEMAFYKNISAWNPSSVHGGVFHEGGGMEMILGRDVSLENWRVVGNTFVHELGHWPAQRVYTERPGTDPSHRLVSIGFDKRRQLVEILGTRYRQADVDDVYMSGVFREPLADLFGYYCTEKRGDGVSYRPHEYYRETAFMVAMLSQLASVRNTTFFAEFAKLYKAFNEREYNYFLSLRDDMAKVFAQRDGLVEKESIRLATGFVSRLNKIKTEKGKDRVLTLREGAIDTHMEGGQLTEVAKMGGFMEAYKKNCDAIWNGELVLEGMSTRMRRSY